MLIAETLNNRHAITSGRL